MCAYSSGVSPGQRSWWSSSRSSVWKLHRILWFPRLLLNDQKGLLALLHLSRFYRTEIFAQFEKKYPCRAVIFLHCLDAVGWLRESAYALMPCKIVCQQTNRCCVAILGLTQGVAADQWAGETNLKVVIIRSAVNLFYNSGYCAFSTLPLLTCKKSCFSYHQRFLWETQPKLE